LETGGVISANSQTHSQPQHVNGRLRLGFSVEATSPQTSCRIYEQCPPLQVVRAFPLREGGTLVHLHNLSGGVLGGDRLKVAVEVGPGATAQVTSTGATRLYRSRTDAPAAEQATEIQISAGGLLEYLPDPLIPFAGSRYRQSTRITLEDDAGLFWWETIAPGRAARGELFAYDLLHVRFELAALGKPIAREHFVLEPQKRPLSALARLGPYRYLSCLYICRVGLEEVRWLGLEEQMGALAGQFSQPGEIIWGVSSLVAHGLVVRGLSRQGQDIPAGLVAFWHVAKQALYGQDAHPPRKIY
jgi:urease accessory protein